MSADAAFAVEEIVDAAHLSTLDQELCGYQQTEEVVDTTLGYVVEWLRARGDAELSDRLDSFRTSTVE